MKKYFFIIGLFLCSFPATAKHVAGGELFYEYMGPGNVGGTSTYRITLRLFRDCQSTGPLLENEPVTVGIYSGTSLVNSLVLPISGGISTIKLNTAGFPCLVGDINVCYQVAIYTNVITLPDSPDGYTLSRLGCCRVDNITNLAQKTSVGSNYVTRIPGTNTLPVGHNSSPQFLVKDTALVCANKSFKLDFGAVDPDGDQLTYSLCEAYTAPSGGNNSPPTATLSLNPLPYASPYNGNYPLGNRVQINGATGIISGIAPSEGSYVINVCISEWRNGKVFTQHRKDFILKIKNCDFIEAVLPEKIIQCKDFTVHFENQSTSSAITSYLWTFGDPQGFTSHDPIVDYTYADTGTYIARLTVNGPQGCVGEASTTVIVYPGFTPGFTVSGSCLLNPFQFKDATITKYGVVDSWQWDFGETTTDADTSSVKNPFYTYLTPSVKNVGLIVTNSKGCIDTVHQDYTVRDKPLLNLPFRDTLICSIDSLLIHVSNPGIYSWTPNKNILFANTSDPVVFPKDTTRYIVSLADNGCINTDTVTVNVLQFIKVDLGNDTLICKTDTIRLNPVSYALGYKWTSSSGVLISNSKRPLVQPLVNTKYYVIANLGKCEDKDSIQLKVVPYPVAIVGPDTTICLGSRIQLRSTVAGSSFSWTPVNSLINANITSPIAGPSKTTVYVLKVSDTLGCPKPSSDTILVTVAPKVIANAGRDTVALPGQPLQLEATGGQNYLWTPEIFLSNINIPNPIATLDANIDSIKYKVKVLDANGCFSEDEIVIRVYKTGPDIFVPSAFTPNGDGKNDVLKPYTVGISKLSYFNVYNRWGQLVFTTTELGKGWDGLFNGAPQPANAYVFSTEGTDYTGKTVYRKGTTELIR